MKTLTVIGVATYIAIQAILGALNHVDGLTNDGTRVQTIEAASGN